MSTEMKLAAHAGIAAPRRAMDGLRRETRGLRVLLTPARLRLGFWTGCARLLPTFVFGSLRARLYRLAGCDISRGVALLGPLTLIGEGDCASRLHIGEGSVIGPGVTFGLDGEIVVGRNVSISPNATVYTATHALGFGSRRMSPTVQTKRVVVEDGVWVGMSALLLPGVTLGHGSVVSAGSVVVQDVAPDTLAAGNPAVQQQTLPFGNR